MTVSAIKKKTGYNENKIRRVVRELMKEGGEDA